MPSTLFDYVNHVLARPAPPSATRRLHARCILYQLLRELGDAPDATPSPATHRRLNLHRIRVVAESGRSGAPRVELMPEDGRRKGPGAGRANEDDVWSLAVNVFAPMITGRVIGAPRQATSVFATTHKDAGGGAGRDAVTSAHDRGGAGDHAGADTIPRRSAAEAVRLANAVSELGGSRAGTLRGYLLRYATYDADDMPISPYPHRLPYPHESVDAFDVVDDDDDDDDNNDGGVDGGGRRRWPFFKELEETWGMKGSGVALLRSMLNPNPVARINPTSALLHPYFTDLGTIRMRNGFAEPAFACPFVFRGNGRLRRHARGGEGEAGGSRGSGSGGAIGGHDGSSWLVGGVPIAVVMVAPTIVVCVLFLAGALLIARRRQRRRRGVGGERGSRGLL